MCLSSPTEQVRTQRAASCHSHCSSAMGTCNISNGEKNKIPATAWIAPIDPRQTFHLNRTSTFRATRATQHLCHRGSIRTPRAAAGLSTSISTGQTEKPTFCPLGNPTDCRDFRLHVKLKESEPEPLMQFVWLWPVWFRKFSLLCNQIIAK